MTALTVHEAAEIFPLMSEAELKALSENIATEGLKEPIVLYEGQVLDGRNRLEACRRAGVKPTFTEIDLNGTAPIEYVVKMNIDNRNLSIPQRCAIAVQLLPGLAERAHERRILLARSRGQAEVPPELGALGASSGHASDLVGVGRTSVERAARLIKKYPEVLPRMLKGEFVSVNHAFRAMGEQTRRVVKTDGISYKQYGRGDRWNEVIHPINLYLTGWRKKSFEYRHVNPTEARKRLKELDRIQEGLDAIRADLEPRSVKAKTKFDTN